MRGDLRFESPLQTSALPGSNNPLLEKYSPG